MKVTSKAEFFRLWRAGVLGNRTRLWDGSTLHQAHWAQMDAMYLEVPSIGFRELGRSGGGAWERVPTRELKATAQKWRDLGRKFIMDDGVPDEQQTIQGEVCRTIRGLEGFIGASKIPMREAIAAGLVLPRTASEVLVLFETYMDPSSREDVMDLLELYPDATIEFTCFSVDVGQLPGRNTIIWEVRDY